MNIDYVVLVPVVAKDDMRVRPVKNVKEKVNKMEKLYTCGDCGFEFKEDEVLRQHLEEYLCMNCAEAAWTRHYSEDL